jgi:hypothetical protein
MIAAFMALAGRYWKPLALVLVVMAAFAYRAVLIHERDAARGKAARLAAENAELDASVAQLTAALKRQDEAVAAMRQRALKAAAALAVRSQAADAQARAVAARARGEALRIVHARIDSGCAAAIRWGNREAKELSRW